MWSIVEQGRSGSAWNNGYLIERLVADWPDCTQSWARGITLHREEFVGWIGKVTTRLIYVDYKPTSAS